MKKILKFTWILLLIMDIIIIVGGWILPVQVSDNVERHLKMVAAYWRVSSNSKN